MKRDFENLNLRDAFRPEPEDCHAALMNAARSVKEEKEMKRASFRVVLIAAAILVSMMAVAFAAGGLMGWTDFLGNYTNVTIPQGAVERMKVSEEISWQVGPMTFTVTELLTDERMAISAIHVRPTDGTQALMCVDPSDVIGCNGENGRALAAKLGVDPMTPYTEAAQQLNLPLYCVRGILDIASEYAGGDGMEDPLWNEDGSLTYFSMLSLNRDAVQSELPARFYLRVAQLDPATGEEVEKWVDRDRSVTVPVSPVLETRSYVPEQETVIAGHRLLKAEAERYVTGAYLTLTFEMNYMDVPESAYGLYELKLRDAAGSELPEGMNLSRALRFLIEEEVMLGVETLPDVITLTDEVLPETIPADAPVVLLAK
ncbi:MAG: hypothetical protein ACI4MG_07735 [Aristaeellaceae bacterium]